MVNGSTILQSAVMLNRAREKTVLSRRVYIREEGGNKSTEDAVRKRQENNNNTDEDDRDDEERERAIGRGSGQAVRGFVTWMVTSYKKCSYHNVHIEIVFSDVRF